MGSEPACGSLADPRRLLSWALLQFQPFWRGLLPWAATARHRYNTSNSRLRQKLCGCQGRTAGQGPSSGIQAGRLGLDSKTWSLSHRLGLRTMEATGSRA